jgi:glutamate-5-semialdehyde dehydrogenase
MKDIDTSLTNLKAASKKLANLSDYEKTDALLKIADLLQAQSQSVLQANVFDVELARNSDMPAAMVDRLFLDDVRWLGVITDLRRVAELPDPVGKILENKILANGLEVSKRRVPLGVVAVIYESRPNVTVDVIGLAIKSGNGVVLRGGKETLNTNIAIIEIIKNVLEDSLISPDVVLFIDDPDRGILMELMKRYDLIDMLIPRGGAGLHKFCRENSLIPVITGGIGICHLFVDESANQEKSIEVIRNAKIQRPTVCNALDTVLVHEKIASELIPQLVKQLGQDRVKFHVDPVSYQILGEQEGVHSAGADDFDKEWLSLTLGIKIVNSLDEAISHIQEHSTGHSDGILTEDSENGEKFLQLVDSAAVYVNASTRFTDGSALGLGAEIAISTQKLHARGPMALDELTSYKWIIKGNYHARN